MTVAPYCGQNQTASINVANPGPPWEDGPNVMCPYTYGPYAIVQGGTEWVPPMVYRTELWRAMQTWPLPQAG
jgi:hypothetical protein